MYDGGGFSTEMAIHAYSAIDGYIYGFALQEQQLPFETPEEVGEVSETMLSQFPAGEHPSQAQTIAEIMNKSGWQYADEFEFGLYRRGARTPPGALSGQCRRSQASEARPTECQFSRAACGAWSYSCLDLILLGRAKRDPPPEVAAPKETD